MLLGSIEYRQQHLMPRVTVLDHDYRTSSTTADKGLAEDAFGGTGASLGNAARSPSVINLD